MTEETPQVAANPPPEETKPAKQHIDAGAKIAAIIPRNHDEAWRLAGAFFKAGLVPKSYEVTQSKGGPVDDQATIARMMIGIMKGLEVGLAPVTALSTIMVINNRPCVWGDGAKALVLASGKAEYIRDHLEGTWGQDMVATVEAKRHDQSEPIVRTFSFDDAKRAGLVGKSGPWSSGYAPRMLLMRAMAWALRDGFADALNGLAIAEEIRDLEVEAKRNHVIDTSDLDGPKQIANQPAETAPGIEIKGAEYINA